MAGKADKLIALGFEPLVDFVCSYTPENGEIIEEWLSSDPQPTQQQIDAVKDKDIEDAKKAKKAKKIKDDNLVLIGAIADSMSQIPGAPNKNQIEADIIAYIDSNT